MPSMPAVSRTPTPQSVSDACAARANTGAASSGGKRVLVISFVAAIVIAAGHRDRDVRRSSTRMSPRKPIVERSAKRWLRLRRSDHAGQVGRRATAPVRSIRIAQAGPIGAAHDRHALLRHVDRAERRPDGAPACTRSTLERDRFCDAVSRPRRCDSRRADPRSVVLRPRAVRPPSIAILAHGARICVRRRPRSSRASRRRSPSHVRAGCRRQRRTYRARDQARRSCVRPRERPAIERRSRSSAASSSTSRSSACRTTRASARRPKRRRRASRSIRATRCSSRARSRRSRSGASASVVRARRSELVGVTSSGSVAIRSPASELRVATRRAAWRFEPLRRSRHRLRSRPARAPRTRSATSQPSRPGSARR